VAVTPELLSRLRTLDDLHELVAALGYEAAGEELNPGARERLGLGDGLGTRRAAIVGRQGTYLVYGVLLDAAPRHVVATALERLSRATPGERNLLIALDAAHATLAVAARAPSATGFQVRQFRVALGRVSAVAAEILTGLAPRPNDTALTLSVRAADVLADEGLTSRFFREFARLYEGAAAQLRDVPRATTSERRDLALLVLTRLLFLYFVQAKGWLDGRSDFLPSLLDTALGRGGHPFHRSVFEPLCFGALNTPVGARRGVARALGGVPFLNGGLFERHAIERRFPGAHLPNEVWRELFDDLFERFHFTVRERDDADAVDPEMLGRVFEGLMAPGRRRSSGTYFTPRELLHETVRTALCVALDGASPEALRTIRILDPAVGSGAFLLEALTQLERLRAERCPDETPALRRRAIVRDNLFGVDLDPMAVRLAELRLWLALVVGDDADWEHVAPLPNLDRNLRQGDSLLSPLDVARAAGAPGTTMRLQKVAEQRSAYFAATGREKAALACAITVEERGLARETTEAAIVSLTARLADAAAATGRDLFGARGVRQPDLARRVSQWRRERRELLALRGRIGDEAVLPFFAYDVHFGDVMAAGGFDVVLGNPPWVRGERVPVSARERLARRYETFRAAPAGRGFAHLPDLAVAFVERALELARPGGVVALVLPSKLLRSGYAGPLRLLVRRTATVRVLDDRSHAPASGFAATVFPLVCVLERTPPQGDRPAAVRLVGASGRALEGRAAQGDLGLDTVPSRAPWLGLPGDMVRAVRAALRAGPRFASRFRPQLGVKTGANDVFVRDLAHAGELPEKHRVPAVLGRDVAPFRLAPSCVLLAALDERGAPLRDVPPEIVGYLKPHAGALARRADAHGCLPWTLFRTDLLRGRRLVIWRDIANRLEAAPLERTSPRDPVPLNTCYGAIVPDEFTACWLAAWLNSGPIRGLACVLAERASGGAFRFAAGVVGALPLPRRDAPELRELVRIGRDAAAGKECTTDDLDDLASRALALDRRAAALLHAVGDALRRDADGNR